jgi:hypothetical protein
MAHVIANHKKVQKKRLLHKVWFVWERPADGARQYGIRSGESDQVYTVWALPNGTYICSCTWGQFKRLDDPACACSHPQAVDDWRNLHERGVGHNSAWGTEEDAQRQHKPTRYIGDNTWITDRAHGA